MSWRSWFWLAVLAGNAVGIAPAWAAGNPAALIFCFGVGWSLSTLTNSIPTQRPVRRIRKDYTK